MLNKGSAHHDTLVNDIYTGTQLTCSACSKSTLETLEKFVKYVQG